MSSGISARLKLYKKPELTKSASQVLLNKLQQEGSMRTIENAMQRVEYVYCLLLSKNIDATAPYKDDIHELLQTLKVYGAYLDLLYPEQLNRSFVVFRNCSQDEERLDYLSRLYLLELIELRANSWKTNDITGQYYKKKASQYAQVETLDTASSLTDSMISSASSMAPILGPGEVIKPSGKFTKPTRIPGKNYCKDEVVIRNADSGKVMGIKGRRVHMIEELSETIISFQRGPTHSGDSSSPRSISSELERAFSSDDSVIDKNYEPSPENLSNEGSNQRVSPLEDLAVPSTSKTFSNGNDGSNPIEGNETVYPCPDLTIPFSPGAKERLVQITGASEDSINHAKQLIEDTIRRNASPVREQSILGAPLTGSSSSINSSASDDSALPHSARASRTLLHSLSSNDATVGEYKYTVLVGNSVIKITGNNLDIVRTSKLVLDEYFSGEPIQDIGQFYSFDSLPQPISESPLSPPESPNSLPNGKLDEPLPVVRLRKPRTSIEDIMKGNIPAAPVQSVPRIPYIKHIYSIELLARLAMSPLCLVQPINWDDISTVYPNLVRKETEYFDAKQYLSNRSNYGYSTIVNAGNGAEDS